MVTAIFRTEMMPLALARVFLIVSLIRPWYNVLEIDRVEFE